MNWIVTPAIGLILSSIIAYSIYVYRSLVIYHSVTVSRYLSYDGQQIVVKDSYTPYGLCYSVLTIKNYGFRNIKDFLFSNEESFSLRSSKVINTSSIDAGLVLIIQDANRLLVSCPFLPKNEKIEIEIITDRSLSFWKVRGHGDQYRLQSHAYLEGFRGALSFLLWMLAVVMILSLLGAVVGLLAAKG